MEQSNEFKEIGNAFIETSRYKQAIEYFSKAIDADPSDAEAYDLRSIAWFRLLNIENAIKDLEIAVTVDPEYHIAFAHLGEIANTKNDFDKAEEYYSKALEVFPDNTVYLQNLAFAKLKLKKYSDCLELCNTILKDYPTNKTALYYRGSVYLKLKKYTEALADHIKFCEEDINNAIGYNNLGYTYGKIGIIDKAKYNLNLCLKLNPEYAYAHNNLGYVYYLENNFDTAIELINTSINMDPSNSYAFKNRALIYLKQNKIAEANDDLIKAIELGFTNDHDDEVERLLEKINNAS